MLVLLIGGLQNRLQFRPVALFKVSHDTLCVSIFCIRQDDSLGIKVVLTRVTEFGDRQTRQTALEVVSWQHALVEEVIVTG